VTIIALAAVGISRLPGIDERFPLSLIISITEPADETVIFLGDTVNVRVDTFTSPVPDPKEAESLGSDQYELWVDGMLISSMDGEPPALDGGRYKYSLWFPWIADQPGLHTLVVVGKSKYWNDVSDIVHVRVVDLASLSEGESYVPHNTETLNDISYKFGLSPVLLGAANPEIPDLSDPLPSEQPIKIPNISFTSFPSDTSDPSEDLPAGATTTPARAPLDRVSTWLVLNIFSPVFSNPTLPAAPLLFRFKESCDVTFYIRDNSDNELGFFVYRLDPGSTAFKRIATLGPHKGDLFIEYTDKGLYGNYQYYVAAFNGRGESASNFSLAGFSDLSCAKPEATVYKFDRIDLSVDLAIDKAYCYYSLQEGDWSRIPAAADSFFYPTANGFNLTRDLSNLSFPSQSEMELDCWGWEGETLTPLGSGSLKVDPARPVNLNGDHFALNASLSALTSLSPLTLMDKHKKFFVAAPINLTATSNVDTCINHFPLAMRGFFGPLFCKAALENGDIILVWTWPKPMFPLDLPDTETVMKVDGYYVYKYYPGGKPVLIKTINDPDQTVLIQPAESSLKLPTYFVRAYHNVHISDDSNHYSMTGGGSAGLLTVSIPATLNSVNAISYFTDETSKVIEDSDCTMGLGSEAVSGMGSEEIAVGYEHFDDKGCTDLLDTYFRGSILFDLSPIKGPVSNATMTYIQGKTNSDAPGTYSTGGQSCAATLNITTGISTGGVETFDPYRTLTSFGYSGLKHSVNVTEAVRDWMLGERNLGFVLIGRDEGFPEENDVCWSRYKFFVLEVTYFDLSK
jgi:hypothetical protein